MQYDLIVIGGGPAGYVGAIRAAQLGKKVACIEADRAGGTCLNWGCIPTKALVNAAGLYQSITHRAAEFGISVDRVGHDWPAVIGRSRKVSDRLAGGIEFLFKKNKVDYLRGRGSLLGRGEVEFTPMEGGAGEVHTAGAVLIATGCRPRELPFLPIDGSSVISSKEAMTLERQPKDIVIIGVGAIGVEFAYFFNAFGTGVTLIEMMDHLLPGEDTEVSKLLERAFRKQKIKFLTKTKTHGASVTASGVELTLGARDGGGEPKTISAERCLVAVGVDPVLPGGADDLRLSGNGFIDIDSRYQTSLPGVYAAGDIIGPPWLAHVASFEAIQAVDGIFLGKTPKPPRNVPACTYCHPEVASVGLTEQACQDRGTACRVGSFPFLASGRAQTAAETEGMVKLVFEDREDGKLLGAHIIGAGATELIAEMGLALTLGATRGDLEATIHAHPTLSEAIHEATAAAFGQAIHL